MARKSKTDIDTKKDRKTSKKKKAAKDVKALEQSFAAALKAVENSPESEDSWDHLEDIADELQQPDEVAALYRLVLDRRLPKDIFTILSHRAVGFHEEWFGDSPDTMSDLFSKIIEIDPSADWAFDQLTMTLTVAKKWDKLLDIYNRVLGTTRDPARRRRLLDDALHVAKDFADQPARAVDYLKQILVSDPENKQLVSSLERLLERLESWQELIDLWNNQIPNLKAGEARKVRLKTAGCFLDKIKDPDKAIEALRTLLSTSPAHREGMELLERILDMESAPVEARRNAIGLLRTNYDNAKQSENVIRVLERGLEFVDQQEWVSLHREVGNRLAILGKDTEAIEHYGALLRKHPNDTDVRKHLAELARRSSRHDLHANVLVEAADACEDEGRKVALLVEAAQIHRDTLNDTSKAIDLYSRVVDSEKADRSIVSSAAHVLNDLLSEAGRSEERLQVLERLASLERASTARRAVLGQAARLARELGNIDRALSAWNSRLETDPNDLEALESVIELYAGSERWEALIDALRKRAGAGILPQQQRADLIRIAAVQAEKLDNTNEAIDTWLQVRRDFGEEAETIKMLDELMASAGRWQELADIMKDTAVSWHDRAGALLYRLGDINRVNLDDPKQAVKYYTDALSVNPGSSAAREGLLALLDNRECTLNAAQVLTKTYEATDDWKAAIELHEPYLAAAPDKETKVNILQKTAAIQEKRAEDPGAALRSLSRALSLAPEDMTLEKEVKRLASITGDWKVSAEAFHEAAEAIIDNPARASQLWYEEGLILETELDNAAGAAEAYEKVYQLDKRRKEILKDAARVAAESGRWGNAAGALVSLTEARNYIDDEVLKNLEAAADKASAWDDLSSSLTEKVAQRSKELRNELIRDFEMKIASWNKDKRRDFEAAAESLRRAVKHGATHVPVLMMLADMQRQSPGPKLVETLMKIDDLTDRNLDALFEATDVAMNSCDDRELALSALQKLFLRATNLWNSSEQTEGEKTVEVSSEWALDHLVRLYGDAGEHQRAVQLLIEGARLPFDHAKSRNMRLRAAEILAEKGERNRAIELYFKILESTADDLQTIQKVASLCEKENRATELLALRLRELDLSDDPERRLELRLEISRATGNFEEKGGRVESLVANLEERPGHEASIEELRQVLLMRGHYDRLADILSQQAENLQEKNEPERAAQLWAGVADLTEKNLHDNERAILAHTHVVELSCTNEALDSLARLYIERDDPAKASTWLQRRLEGAGEKERVPILLKLARASIKARQYNQAVDSLETAFEEAPRNAEVRRLLLEIYRKQDAWESLARVLTKAAEHTNDEAMIIAYAREAYNIYKDRLGITRDCVKILQKAVSLAPEERDLKRMLADGLFATEDYDEARELTEDIIEEYRRRRSPERAGMHMLLARIAHSQGDVNEALNQLETAAKMDTGNLTIMKTMAELAREGGDLEKAELAYHTLLMTVRRRQSTSAVVEQTGQSEVLLELSRIARDRGQDEQASELLESSIEALTQNDAEATRLQENLRRHEEYELLHRILKTRLAQARNPRKKAIILSELADVLDSGLEKEDEAFDARLQAVDSDPASPRHHKSAHDLAIKLEKLDTYVTKLEKLLGKTRRSADAHLKCELLLRLGEIYERDNDDLDKASEFYEKAEKTGVREVDVWRAAARVAGARGFVDEQMRLLNRLATMGAEQTETRADALYSLAEIQLAHEDTLAEGLETITKALDEEPRYERAGVILGRASETHANNKDILTLYEKAARKSEDPERLLHYLEQKVAHPEATPEEAKEASDMAIKLEKWDRGEAVMLRAVDIGRELIDEMKRVEWALLGLAERRKHAGNLAGAVKWLGEAIEVMEEPDRVFAIARDVVDLAAEPEGDLSLASSLYEGLMERYPMNREVWEPLAGIYAKMGDLDRLSRLVDETLDSLSDASERNALRLQQAIALMNTDDMVDDAVEILRNILLEDPEYEEAQSQLINYFERSARKDDLIELLQNNLMAAQGRKDVPAIKSITLRLGKRLEDNRPEDAVSLYRSSLEWAKEDRDLLEALLTILGPDHDPRERAELMERLLPGEEGERAVKLAFELEALYKSLEDEKGALRAIELGYNSAPDNEEIFSRLEQTYEEQGNFRELARKLTAAAQQKDDTKEAVGLLLKAASIYRESLNDSVAASGILGKAAELAPDDTSIAVESASCMIAAGESRQAIERISSILESAGENNELRFRLLKLRASVYASLGDNSANLDDLEEAYTIDASVAGELEEALRKMAESATEKGDYESERKSTLRYADLLLSMGNREEGRELLDAWVSHNTQDIDALYKLRDLNKDDENWEGVAKTCTQLVTLEEGEAQIKSILQMSRAYCKLERPADARIGLEHAYRNQPENKEILKELKKIYEAAGVWKELALLIRQEANVTEDADEKMKLLRRAGELYIQDGEAVEAIPILENILSLAPDDYYATALLADAYIAGNQLDSADLILDDAISELKGRRSPELCLVQHRKARAARARGDRETQLQLLQQAFKMDRNNGVVAAELADLAEELENWDVAITALRNIPLIKTECPISRVQAYLRQGNISERLGDHQRAVFWAKKALKEEPESPEAAAFLREIDKA